MEPAVRDTLRALILRYGHSLCDDPRRCEAMLRDLCGEHKREVFILVSALRQRVAVDLLNSGGGLPAPMMLGRLRKRLEDELALREDAAHWAVETWAVALGVIAEPVPTAPPATAPAVRPSSGPARLPEPEMVRIPAGRFLMGSPPDEPERNDSEGPQHWVEVSAFELGKYAVTFDEWDACVAAGGSAHDPRDEGWGRGRRPVINVSWDDAQAYCQWLSRQTGKTHRLPSEAEWEYACRAGTTTPFSTGRLSLTAGSLGIFRRAGTTTPFFSTGRTIDTSQANYHGHSAYNGGPKTGVILEETQPVGSYPPNPWGLYDMHGNVWEWVEDCWNDAYGSETSPGILDRLRGRDKESVIDAPSDGSAWRQGDCARRVVRGGSWTSYPRNRRSGNRSWLDTGYRNDNLGFRVARTLTP